MDLAVLKKRISSYRTEGGHLTKVTDELAMDILLAWEEWTGPAKGFYTAIGVNQHKMATIIGKAKKLRREGFPTDSFKEIRVSEPSFSGACFGLEILWDNGKIIRFQQVEQLVDFLRAVGGSCTAAACPAKKVA